jgi:hypothetical protein
MWRAARGWQARQRQRQPSSSGAVGMDSCQPPILALLRWYTSLVGWLRLLIMAQGEVLDPIPAAAAGD